MGIYHGAREEIPEDDVTIPIGKADVKRQGSDVTIVATALMTSHALRAADQLQSQGISAEVIDPRTIVPMDKPAILQSIAKTKRLVVASETWKTGDPLADLIATAAEEIGTGTGLRVARVALADIPRPFALPLEKLSMPSVQTIVDAVRRVMN